VRVLLAAVWAPYDGNLDPTVNGFSAGTSRVGTAAYVGRGHHAGQFLSGRVSVIPPTGVLTSWGSEQFVTNPEYLTLPNNCSCSWVAPASALTRVGLVHAQDPTYHFLVGRKTFPNGQVAVTRVVRSSLTQWYNNQNNGESVDQATELLVCETP
jgi:hypothetical protein